MSGIKLSVGLFLLLLLYSCTPDTIKNLQKECSIDSDCIPAQCCHATDALNKAAAPDCKNIFCTEECKPGTLDCGQGEIKCVENSCVVII